MIDRVIKWKIRFLINSNKEMGRQKNNTLKKKCLAIYLNSADLQSNGSTASRWDWLHWAKHKDNGLNLMKFPGF